MMKYFVLTENMDDKEFEMLKNPFHPIQLIHLHMKIVQTTIYTYTVSITTTVKGF